MADEEDQVEDGAQEDGMDTEGIDEDAVDEDEESGGGKKKLIIALVILILAGGGAGAYFTGLLDPYLGTEAAEGEEGAEDGEEDHGDKKKGNKKKDKSAKKGDDHDEEGGGDTAFLAIPTMIVNLNTEDGVPRYLRLTVQLELEDPSEKAAVEAIIPRVIDQFQTYLRELRVRDLRGSAGIYRLQMELLWRVNQAADPIEIKDVLFQEILIQ